MSSRCAGSPSEKEGSHLAGIAQGSGCTRKSAAEAEASPARRRSTARARWQRATTHNSCKSLPCTWDTSCPVRTATDPETWRRNFGGFSLPCPCALKDQRLEAQALAGAYGSSVQVGPLHLSIRCCSRCRSVARLRQALRPQWRRHGEVKGGWRASIGRQENVGRASLSHAIIRSVWQKESGFFLLGLEASNVEPPVEKVSESVVTLHPFPPSHGRRSGQAQSRIAGTRHLGELRSCPVFGQVPW